MSINAESISPKQAYINMRPVRAPGPATKLAFIRMEKVTSNFHGQTEGECSLLQSLSAEAFVWMVTLPIT